MALNTACMLCTSVLRLSAHRVEKRFNTNQFNYYIKPIKLFHCSTLLYTKKGQCTVTTEDAEKVQ